ncbi:hypothetical protein QBC40DRAFT_268467 [Triangularia verruculosa]|uniref:Uncharacterized protein n=1 Tax=Triangularia verruculosa TaxID=2587418 RepID=A0AAN7APK8_9PEZI|nr:hypothetical protein QBC40DRAFT_268467 [Triangularia verruculosa]
MIASKVLAYLPLALCSLFGVSVASNHDSIGKRDSLLEERQGCRTSGWIPACPGLFKCVPPGAICCSDGITYVMPPRNCPNGQSALATATIVDPVPTITTIPAPTITTIDYIWYTFTYYYSYNYYYYYADATTTILYTTLYTTSTAVSLTATDAAAATSLYNQYTRTVVLATPTQTVTTVSATQTISVEPEPTTTTSFSASPSVNGTISLVLPTSTSSVVEAGAKRNGAVGGLLGLILGFAAML